MRGGGEGVLLGAGDGTIPAVGRLGERAHRLVGEDVVQTVEGHVIAQDDIAVLEAGAGLGEQVRGLRHGLLAAGDDDVELPARIS